MLSLQWSELLKSGGVTLFVLLICFLLAAILIIERLAYYRTRNREVKAVLAQIATQEASHSLPPREAYQLMDSPVSYVLNECYPYVKGDLFEEVKSRAIAEKVPEMDRYLNVLATLGTVSPYIGLLGTVFGIIRAFMSLGGGAGDTAMSGLNAGIAESLAATAAGLFVAIPATIFFNYFRRRSDALLMQIEIAASRLKTLGRG
ncbi:MAG: MotA/TolQ/ExbB proton channel family protein [Spirochaetia bacterium]|nr:MotA/TolQ/ExbB proton channel family protein [Spirochaetia bacterium]